MIFGVRTAIGFHDQMTIMETYVKETEIAASARDVYEWHREDEAFERLIPPGEPVRILSRSGGIDEPGSRVTLEITLLGPLRIHWVAEHRRYEEGRMFQDVQVKGPFSHWEHTHEMVPVDENRCLLRDHIEYALPGGWLGRLLAGWFVRKKLRKMFEHRHRVTRTALEKTQSA